MLTLHVRVSRMSVSLDTFFTHGISDAGGVCFVRCRHLMRLYPGFTRLPVLLHSEMRLHARVPIINLRFLNNVR